MNNQTVVQATTPWQVVFSIFGMKQAELAREIGVHRSKISIALRDPEGLINSRDQMKLMKLAKRSGVSLKPHHLMPVVK